MRAGRGFSLIELMIGGVLLGMFLTSVVSALWYCNRYLRTAENKVAAQGQALQASMWISRTMSESSIKACQATPGLGVVFASPRTPGTGEVAFSGGQLVWKQHMAYYLTTGPNNTPMLMHKGFEYGPPDRLDPLAPMDLPTVISTNTPHTRVIARFVRQLEIETYGPTHADLSLRSCTRVVAETFVPHYGLDYGVTVRTQVRLDN